jgi:hypothetical protein
MKSSRQGLKPASFASSSGTAEQAAEKVVIRCPAPKGASDFEELTVSLKRYPDTNSAAARLDHRSTFSFALKL